MSAAEVVRQHVELLRLSERLIREHRDSLAAGAVIRAVAAARDELRSADQGLDLLVAVEASARRRLRLLLDPV